MRNPKPAVTYLDHNASSPVPRFLLEELRSFAERCVGNPSSSHVAGRESRRLLNEATVVFARKVNCRPEQVFWTSGASEANSWVISSFTHAKRIVLSTLEHESTKSAAKQLCDAGTRVEYLRTLPNGQIDVEHLRSLLGDGTPVDLVSALHSNNETGVIQPIDEISALCQTSDVALHVDCVASLSKHQLSLDHLKADYTTFSGHKIGALKGVGVLVAADEGLSLQPLVHGKQQRAHRGGTENALAVASFGSLLEKEARREYEAFPEQLAVWHREFEAELKRRISGTVIHGETSPRLCNTSFVGFEGVRADGILMNLDLAGICASAGSACSTGAVEPSSTLLAMGATPEMARASIRFSSGASTSAEDFEYVLNVLPKLVEKARD